jgi:hypothetical protein
MYIIILENLFLPSIKNLPDAKKVFFSTETRFFEATLSSNGERPFA